MKPSPASFASGHTQEQRAECGEYEQDEYKSKQNLTTSLEKRQLPTKKSER